MDRERTVDGFSDCGLLSLAGIRRSTVVCASRAGCASCLGPVAVEGGVSEARTDSRTTIIEAHWAQVLGADLAEGSQRPVGIPGAWDREAARLLRSSWTWSLCSFSRLFLPRASPRSWVMTWLQRSMAALTCLWCSAEGAHAGLESNLHWDTTCVPQGLCSPLAAYWRFRL